MFWSGMESVSLDVVAVSLWGFKFGWLVWVMPTRAVLAANPVDAIAWPADIPSLKRPADMPPIESKVVTDLFRWWCIDVGAVVVGGLTGVVGSVMPGAAVGADRKM